MQTWFWGRIPSSPHKQNTEQLLWLALLITIMVEVAVIGAGVAGLLATRHLLRCGLRACLFESRLFTGGAWSAAAKAGAADDPTTTRYDHHHTGRPQMWDHLTPNLSRHTCRFSDFPWPETTPTFPTLADMNQYLDDYAAQYVLHEEACTVRYGCTVTRVVRRHHHHHHHTGHETSDPRRYAVEWDDADGGSRTQSFDGVVVATGFFSTPVGPDGLLDWVDPVPTAVGPRRVLHASQYRSPAEFARQTVAVVGGSFSAHEIASDVRRHAQRVVNLAGQRVPYVIPRYVPSPRGFLPVDGVLYQRGNRDDDDVAPRSPETIDMDADACQKQHAYLQSVIGKRKLSQLVSKGFPSWSTLSMQSPPMVSISDDYLNLVIDGKIEVVTGRVKRATLASICRDSDKATAPPATTNNCLNIELEDGTVVTGFDSIIMCTGYRCQLDFLDPAILDTLQYDESNTFAPFVACYDAIHPQLPGLGLVGMYKGPYFGVMELQARLIAGFISGQIQPLAPDVTLKALEASQAIRGIDPRRRAQFPHFDYIGAMDTLAEQLDLIPKAEYGARGMMVSPAFYQPDDALARLCKEGVEEELRRQSENVSRAALSALVGKWTFERSITDSLTSSVQRVCGQIQYQLQEPNFDSLRYREDGFLELPNGSKIEVFREYEYLQKDGVLEIYFVENGERAHLFLSLKFEKIENGYWVATSDHLCIMDLYKGTFRIAFDGIGASAVEMTYRVKGPNKDYESVTILRPTL